MNSNQAEERTPLRIIFSTIAVLVVVGFLVTAVVLAADIFLILLFAVLFAVFLYHSSHFIEEKTSQSYSISLGIVTVLFLVAVFAGIGIFGIQVDQQVDQASKHLDKAQKRITNLIDKYPAIESTFASTPFLERLVKTDEQAKKKGEKSASKKDEKPSTERDTASDKTTGSSIIKQSPIKETVNQILSAVASLFKTTFGLLVNSLLIFFVGLFIAVDPQSYRDGVIRLFPREKRERAFEIMNELGETLWRWLLGRFASMLITGVGAGLLLLILGVPLAITLGIVTALLTFIPNIGGLISLILAVIFALPQGMTVVVMVVVGYIVLQLIESYVVTPLIQKKQVSLPPALLIAFQAIMGVLFGLLGAAAASPILAAGKKFVELAYINDILEAEESSK